MECSTVEFSLGTIIVSTVLPTGYGRDELQHVMKRRRHAQYPKHIYVMRCNVYNAWQRSVRCGFADGTGERPKRRLDKWCVEKMKCTVVGMMVTHWFETHTRTDVRACIRHIIYRWILIYSVVLHSFFLP